MCLSPDDFAMGIAGGQDTATGTQLATPEAQLTACAVKETVSGLDGIVNDIGGDVVADLPEAEAHLGHLGAAVELEAGNLNHLGGAVLLVVWCWKRCDVGDAFVSLERVD